MKFKMNKKLLLIIILLVISLGYAILSSNIHINGSSLLANSRWDIHFDNLNVTEGSVVIDSNDNTQSEATIDPNDNTKIDFNVAFSLPGDFYEFTVDVVNTGTVDGMVNLVTSNFKIGDGEWQEALSSNLPNYIKYRITYLDGDNIARYHELKVGETETYKVRVEFNKDIEPEDLPDTLQEIYFNIDSDYTQPNKKAKDREDNPQFTTSLNMNQFAKKTINFDINYDNCINTFTDWFNSSEDLESYCTGRTVRYKSLASDIKELDETYQYIMDNNVVENITVFNQDYNLNNEKCMEVLGSNSYYNNIGSLYDLCHGEPTYDSNIRLIKDLDYYILKETPEWFTAQGIISDYKTESTKPGVVITKYNDDYASEVIIPDKIDGARVIGIGEYAFYNKHIKNLILPDTIEYIGDDAFRNNQITKVTIPKKVKEVGANAFQDNNLVNVQIVNNNTRVNNCAFGIKNSISNNNIPESYICENESVESELNEYTITFDKNNDDATGNMAEQYVVDNLDAFLSKNNYNLEGYKFIGWNTKSDGTGKLYSDGGLIKTNSDVTLYAQWKKIYVLTLNGNGGEIRVGFDQNTDIYQVEIEKGKTIAENIGTLPEVWNTNNHYMLFDGWYTGIETGERVNESYVLDGDLSLYARWTYINEDTHTLTYDKNAEDATGTMENQVLNAGFLDTNNYSRDGYTFIGWNTERNGTGKSYIDEDYIALTEDTTLYAQWSSNYTITYDKNAEDAIGIMEDQSVIGLLLDTLDQNTYSRDGYMFVGWNTESDGSGTSYKDEDIIQVKNDITLYAQWTRYYTLTFDKNNSQAEGEVYSVQVPAGIYTEISDEASKAYSLDSYYIKRWNSKSDKTGEYVYGSQKIMITEDTTLYAEWEEVKVTPTIYWAIQDNEYDYSDTLVLSSYEVYGKEYGSFDGNKKFYGPDNVPWIRCKFISQGEETGYLYPTAGISNIEIKGMVAPRSTAYWFYNVGVNPDTLNANLDELNTKYVTDMSYMFYKTGYNATTWDIGDISNWDTSNVTDMTWMFGYSGYNNATTWNIGDLSNWDTSKVIDMSCMFYYAGPHATTFDLNLSDWKTSKVIDMGGMFYEAGRFANDWSIGDLSEWKTSNVTNMKRMFEGAGRNSQIFNIGDLSEWNTSKVTDMNSMFDGAGYNATTWYIGNLNDWNTSNVEDMSEMFEDVGKNATSWTVGNLSEWKTSKVTDMSRMFDGAGNYATTWSVGYLNNWNTSKVTDMSYMFESAGENSTTWSIGDLSDWDTSNVEEMSSMFRSAGNNSITWTVGDISNWDTSNVTSMSFMFSCTGEYSTTFSLNLSNWDTSKVTSMIDMFYRAGENATTFNLNLSNWNTSNVTSMSSMFDYAGRNATTWNITIPKDNKNGINNTTDMMYGKTSSTYAYPPSDRQFTLAS